MPFFKKPERRNMASSNTYLFSLGQAIWSNWTVGKALKDGYNLNPKLRLPRTGPDVNFDYFF